MRTLCPPNQTYNARCIHEMHAISMRRGGMRAAIGYVFVCGPPQAANQNEHTRIQMN